MAIRERKVKNKRNSQGILTGRPGIVYDVNVKVYENGKQKSIAKRGFATRREAELYEAQIKLELQTGSAAMVGYGPESKQKLKEYLPKWYESYRHNLAKSTQYSYGSDINLYLIPMLGEVPLNKLTLPSRCYVTFCRGAQGWICEVVQGVGKMEKKGTPNSPTVQAL